MDHFAIARDLLKEFKGGAYRFGNGVLSEVSGIVASGGKRAVLICTPFARAAGYLDTLCDSITQAGVPVAAVIQGARPNTPREDLLRITAELQRADPDVIVSFGGGSTIDAVKAAEVLRTLGGEIDDYFGPGLVTKRLRDFGWRMADGGLKEANLANPQSAIRNPKSLTPHVAIQTAASSAAHLTKYANVTDLQTGQKKLIVDEAIVPAFPVFDYTVTYTAPPALTADGAMDGLSHILEVFYGAVGKPYYDKIRQIAEAGISLIVEYLPKALSITDSVRDDKPKSAIRNPQLTEAREALCLATDLGGYAIMLGGTNGGHLTSFSLVDILSHGRACALMNPYYTVFFAPAIESPLRTVGAIFAQAGYLTQDLTHLHGRDLGVAVAHGMFAFARAIDFPTRLGEVQGFTRSHIDRALTAAKNPQLKMKLENMPIPLTADRIDDTMGPILEAAVTGDVDVIKNV
ncbi:MAG: iron-containing alcohol dehydrogenase [Phycisphaerae bacterium]|nr:iron-containing alcohol dehydrogenase [Phycisphaerae bacterium]